MDDATLTELVCTQLGRLPGWVYGSEYSSADVGIFYGAIAAAPHQAIGVRVYDIGVAPHLGWRRVQLRLRGSQEQPDGADKLAGPAIAAVEGLAGTRGISTVTHLSMAPSGADSNQREERTDNFLIILDNQETLT